MTKTCKACGDLFDPQERPGQLKEQSGEIELAENEYEYCIECANELFRNMIDDAPARIYPSGRGCPMEDFRMGSRSEDPSPWEENSIRIMEGE